MRNKLLFISFLLGIIIVFSACKEEALVDVELKVSPDTLIMMDTDTAMAVFLSTHPKGKVEFLISQKPAWLKIEPEKGLIDGKLFPVKIVPLLTNLSPGTHDGTVSITSDIAGTLEVKVSLLVHVHPKLKISVSQLSFPENSNQAVFELENTGTGTVTWSSANVATWLTLSRTSGTLAAGQKTTITATCIRNNMDIGTYNSSFIINSNSEVAVQPVTVSMTVPRLVILEISQQNVTFDYLTSTITLNLKNSGNCSFDWSAVAGNYIRLDKSSGALGKAETTDIIISADRSNLQSGTFQSTIVFTYNQNSSYTTAVSIKNFVNTKWLFDRNIVDAEFCRATNKIVIISTNPDRLSVIDPDQKTIESVSLHTTPRCVSISRNGHYAAVGHNGMISYINMDTKTLEKEFLVGCDVLDVILTTSGWIYAFPVRDQWTRLSCVNTTTGVVTLQTGNSIYAGEVGALHPSESWIYAADNGISPDDIEKFSIGTGTAALLYDSPYHGDYPMGGNLWFSEDGDRIFTRARTVLRTSTDKASDMIYNGTVACSNNIKTLFHSKVIDKFFLVTQTYNSSYTEQIPSQEVLVFNYSYLNYISKYTLEQFVVPTSSTTAKFVNAEGLYVFVNKEGTKLYVLSRAAKGSGLLNDCAMQIIDIQ